MYSGYVDLIEDIRRFFSDNYHYKLRLICQIKKNNFDKSLDEYKKLFKFEYKNLINKIQNYLKSADNNRVENKIFFEVLNDIDLEEIEYFFEVIKQVYLDWLDHDWEHSMSKFEKILKKYDLLDINKEYNLKNINGQLFFRARYSKENLTNWDMFHIPFDKRHKIKNQRFSITGQPLLYLGGSILNTIYEVGKEDVYNLNFSSYYIPSDNRIKVYDLTNRIYFYDLFINIFVPEINEHKEESSKKYEYLKNDFFKFILISICSFRNKYRDGHFSEEYVIPQILSSIISKSGFEGIVYSSTRINFDITPSNDLINYKVNLVIFTNINIEHVYDAKLFDSLKISNPIKLSDINENLMEDDNIKNLYLRISNSLGDMENYKIIQRTLNKLDILQKSFEKIEKDKDIIKPALDIERYLINIELLDCI